MELIAPPIIHDSVGPALPLVWRPGAPAFWSAAARAAGLPASPHREWDTDFADAHGFHRGHRTSQVRTTEIAEIAEDVAEPSHLRVGEGRLGRCRTSWRRAGLPAERLELRGSWSARVPRAMSGGRNGTEGQAGMLVPTIVAVTFSGGSSARSWRGRRRRAARRWLPDRVSRTERGRGF